MMGALTMERPMLDLHLQMRPALSELEPVRQALVAGLREAGAGHELVYKAELVLEEVLSNIVRHGRAGQIALHARLPLGELRLLFEDDGPAFDPTAQPAPAAAADALSAATGGRGVALVMHFARSISYAHAEGLNRLTVSIAA